MSFNKVYKNTEQDSLQKHRSEKFAIISGSGFRIGIFLLFALSFTFNSSAQNYIIFNGGLINACSGTFTDSGGENGDYSDNENITMTLCSDNGNPVTVTFTLFKTKASDPLTIYNGPNTGSPIMATLFGNLGAGGGTFTSSGTCLTFNFNSRAFGNAVDDGWKATISCDCSVTFIPFDDVCEHDLMFVLNNALPAGGTYSGTGVVGGTHFDPTTAGPGTHTITYSYTIGTCAGVSDEPLTVVAKPVVNFIGFSDTVFCDSDPIEHLIGDPTGANGSFSGNGITDNGDGTATFNPSTSGLGIHTITYTYNDPTGVACSDSYSEDIRVGTVLTFSGLGTDYCKDDPDVSFTYNPPGGSFATFLGLTDEGGGSCNIKSNYCNSRNQND